MVLLSLFDNHFLTIHNIQAMSGLRHLATLQVVHGSIRLIRPDVDIVYPRGFLAKANEIRSA